MGLIADRWQATRKQVADAALAANRAPEDITVMAVSKTFPLTAVEAAWHAGARHFGENYVQEAVEKIRACTLSDITWHFIGPLQSNKTRDVADHFDWVHTVERVKIARRLDVQRPDNLPPLNVCIQVNISRDPAKAGVLPEAVPKLAEQILPLPGLRLRGLMTITAQGLSEPELMKQYTSMSALLRELQVACPQADTLSMGMTEDLVPAIRCGSTCVRIGRAIFGERAVR